MEDADAQGETDCEAVPEGERIVHRVTVAVRLKPVGPYAVLRPPAPSPFLVCRAEGCGLRVEGNTIVAPVGDRQRRFGYDHVFTGGQAAVFGRLGRPMVDEAYEGYNVWCAPPLGRSVQTRIQGLSRGRGHPNPRGGGEGGVVQKGPCSDQHPGAAFVFIGSILCVISLFAYGATGTGKTHSMYGGDGKADEGIIPRLCKAARAPSAALGNSSTIVKT